jgi:hypothetical protein
MTAKPAIRAKKESKDTTISQMPAKEPAQLGRRTHR